MTYNIATRESDNMGKHLTEKERYLIEFMYNKEKRTQREIAKILNKHYNTIYNEIKRGTVRLLDRYLKEYDIYCADVGQRKYLEANARKAQIIKLLAIVNI